MDKISIIVPIYNAEKYLCRCIDSIINQTYKNLEIILIDDGSFDQSGKICDNYALKDNRIVVIHKENGGVSSARNEGIRKSTGTYIAFVDSDDWLEKDMYEKMISCFNVNGIDVVRCLPNHINVHNVKKSGSCNLKNGIIDLTEKKDEIIDDLLSGKETASFWLMLIKKDIIDNNKLFFDTDVLIGEDLLFVIKIYNYCSQMYLLDEFLYNYFIHTQSASHSNHDNFKVIQNLLLLYDKLKGLFIKLPAKIENIDNRIAKYTYHSISYRLAKYVFYTADKTILKTIFSDNRFKDIIHHLKNQSLTKFQKGFYQISRKNHYRIGFIYLYLYGYKITRKEN